MIKPRFTGLLLAALLLIPSASNAFVDLGQGDWISGKNAMLAELLANSFDQIVKLSDILVNVRDTMKAANEHLAIARSAYRQVEAIGDYSWEDLRRDVKRGVYNHFEMLEGIETEASEIQAQYENRNAFFRHWGRHDWRADRTTLRFIDDLFEDHVFKNLRGEEANQRDEAMQRMGMVSPVSKEIFRLWADSGLLADRARDKGVLEGWSELVSGLLKEGSQSDRVDVAAAASSAASSHETMLQAREMADLMKAKAAMEAKDERKARVKGSILQEEIVRMSDRIFAPFGSFGKMP